MPGAKTAGIETDAFAVRFLILGHLEELKRTHDDPGSRPRPGLCGIVQRVVRFADCHHQHELGRPPLQAAFQAPRTDICRAARPWARCC